MMNRQRVTYFILVSALFFGAMESAHAREEDPFGANDNWFFYVSTGIGRPNYGDELENRISSQKSRGGVSHTAGFFDLPAIYRKAHDGLLLGFALNASFEHVAEGWQIKDSYAIHSYNPALSAFWFTDREIGDGWFVRGDLGYSRILEIRESLEPATGKSIYDRDVADGAFSQIGVGYGWSASRLARLLVHGNAFSTFAGERRISGLNFYIGFMF